jgi:hypothetical protein
MLTHGKRYREGHFDRAPLGRLRSACSPIAAVSLGAAAALSLAASAAHADEPRSATEPRIMMEPGEITNVIDAFDDGDTFDLNLSLGFEYSTKSAKIRRETSIAGPGLSSGGYTSNLLNVASYSETTSKLVPRLDIGIYKDLAAYIKLPIIINNSRELTGLDGSDAEEREKVALAGAPGETLFGLPFKSPDRSGVEHIAVGLDLNIMNQARDRTKPTWLFGVEGRFSVGTPMHACNPSLKDLPGGGKQVQCADPGDINRDGETSADVPFEATDVSERDPGVTRGTIGLEVHTILSKRIKYVEPYGGFKALFEFQQKSSDYGLGDLEASLVNHPPLVGTVVLGLMIIPWENREKFGRLTFDLNFAGQYHSEGRDYSEMFDALGSSDASSLRKPQWAAFHENPNYNTSACVDRDDSTPCEPQSVVDEQSQRTYFTGLSDVQPYGSYRGTASVTWQASEYVKFQLGVGFRHDQAHGIGGDQPCNPDLKDSLGSAGPCRRGSDAEGFTVTGSPNPNFRTTINSVGRRFYVDDSNTFDVFASGTMMF